MLLNAIPLPPVTAIEEVNVMLQTGNSDITYEYIQDSYAEAFKLEQNLRKESSSTQTDATERMTHFGARWFGAVRLTPPEDEQKEWYQVHASGNTHGRSFSVSECAVTIPPEPVLKRMVSTPMTSLNQLTLAQPSPAMSCSGMRAPNNEASWLASNAVTALEKYLIYVEADLNALTDKIQSTQAQTATTSRRMVPVTLRTIYSTSELNLCEQQIEDAQYYEAVLAQLSQTEGTELRDLLRRILSSVSSVSFSKQLKWSGIHEKHQASQLKITKTITMPEKHLYTYGWNSCAEITSPQIRYCSKTDYQHGQ
ncbi:hypothetical protein EG68_11896 [Paragonimus skrjabini miyazakii]|uniref:DUF4806 domain-containing protein n=1 Tax=Paragonimus skrjabini miyazakii TaxID=59628 RepID=A0A8S9YNZ5_9TREM|nr:hypothetical protein EG68_11896 [Paragonimus skrjabini miyazakii]